jgi:hypothetical protein
MVLWLVRGLDGSRHGQGGQQLINKARHNLGAGAGYGAASFSEKREKDRHDVRPDQQDAALADAALA